MPHPSPENLRDLVEHDVLVRVNAFGYREPQMLAHGLRTLLETSEAELPAGIKIEDVHNRKTGKKSINRLRVSSAAKPYIDDLRRAVIMERWCDQVLACSSQEAAREVTLLWKGDKEFEVTLTTYGAQASDLEIRMIRVFLATAASMKDGDDYLIVLWNWLRKPSHRDVEGRPRLVHVDDRAVVEELCRTYLIRDLIFLDEIAEVLQQCGFSSIRARLSREQIRSGEDDSPDDLLEPKDAAKLLGISVSTLNNKKALGEIPASLYAQPPGSRIKYRRRALLAWRQGKTSK